MTPRPEINVPLDFYRGGDLSSLRSPGSAGLLCFLQWQQCRCQKWACLLSHRKPKKKLRAKTAPTPFPGLETVAGLSVFLTHFLEHKGMTKQRWFSSWSDYLFKSSSFLLQWGEKFQPAQSNERKCWRNDPLGAFQKSFSHEGRWADKKRNPSEISLNTEEIR